jgi:hypothetical protein
MHYVGRVFNNAAELATGVIEVAAQCVCLFTQFGAVHAASWSDSCIAVGACCSPLLAVC